MFSCFYVQLITKQLFTLGVLKTKIGKFVNVCESVRFICKLIMASIKKILPPQPHFLSGYAGFVPGYKFHCGRTYGGLTHDLFLDPNNKRSKIPILTDLTKVQSTHLSPEEEIALESRCRTRICKCSVDMPPGYEGHVPQYKFLCGKSFTTEAAVGLSKFEQRRRSCLCPECKEAQPRDNVNEADTKIEDINEYKHPFKKKSNGGKTFKMSREQSQPESPETGPYFLDSANPNKRFISGYSGHVPNVSFQVGQSYSPATNEALKLFTTQYETLKRNSMLPITMMTTRPEPKIIAQKLPYEKGVMKGYEGHIPGFKFNVGQTFSDGSKNTRNVLLG